MSLFTYVNGVNQAVSRIRLRGQGDAGISGLSQSADGTGSQGAITFEDPTFDFTAPGFSPCKVDEPDCTSARTLFYGYFAEQTYDRGSHYITGSQREVDVTINDPSVLLTMTSLKAADSPNRPAETGSARATWLLGTQAMGANALIHDVGWIAADAATYDAADFTDQFPFDVLNDLCGARGRVFFVQWDDTSDRLGLFLDDPSSTTYTSTLSFTNVFSELTLSNGEPTGSVYYGADAHMVSDPSASLYCEIVYKYAFGKVTVHSSATHATYFSWLPAGMHRSYVTENSKVGKAATATTLATRLLTHFGQEHRQVIFGTRLPSTKIGLIKAGMRVNLHFTHLPEVSTAAYYRVENLVIAPTEGNPLYYDVTITASLYGVNVPPGTVGGSTQPFPHAPTGADFDMHLHSGTGGGVLPHAPVAGQVATYLASGRNAEADHPTYLTGSWGSGWTKQQTGRLDPSTATYGFCTLWSKTCDGNEGINVTFSGTAGSLFVWNPGVAFGGSAIRTGVTSSPVDCGGTVAPPAGSMVVGGAALGNSWGASAHCVLANTGITVDAQPGFCGAGSVGGMVINQSDDNPNLFEGWELNATSIGGSYSVSVPGSERWAGITYWMTGGTDPGPQPGQFSLWQTIVLAGAVGTLGFPYASGSLQVKVDGILISPASYTENAEAGTFTLSWTPDSTETVTARAQGI